MGGKAVHPEVAIANMLSADAKPLVSFTKKRDPWRSQCLNITSTRFYCLIKQLKCESFNWISKT